MASAFGTMTLGELIDALEATYRNPLPGYFDRIVDKERNVYFDWCDFFPEHFASYRGYYDHLAISPGKSQPAPTVRQFIDHCKQQIGSKHHGWKGGEYTMSRETPVWVSDDGEATGWGITGVTDNGYSVILATQKLD